MKILWINNDGGGFADYVNVNEGTTVRSFFSEKLHDCNPEDYLIRKAAAVVINPQNLHDRLLVFVNIRTY